MLLLRKIKFGNGALHNKQATFKDKCGPQSLQVFFVSRNFHFYSKEIRIYESVKNKN